MLEGFKINCYPLNRTIRISVHLPKDYNSTTRFYPVFYFLDGQNMYSDQDSFRGVSLDLETTIQQLSDSGKDAIYIGIAAANNPLMRDEEYKNTKLANFILNSIHPYLASRYRFNTFIYAVACSDASYTALALAKDELFKGVCLISPVLHFDSISDDIFPNNKLYYIYCGEKELSSSVKENALKLKEKLPDAHMMIDKNEIHNESSWKNILFDALNYFVL